MLSAHQPAYTEVLISDFKSWESSVCKYPNAKLLGENSQTPHPQGHYMYTEADHFPLAITAIHQPDSVYTHIRKVYAHMHCMMV